MEQENLMSTIVDLTDAILGFANKYPRIFKANVDYFHKILEPEFVQRLFEIRSKLPRRVKLVVFFRNVQSKYSEIAVKIDGRGNIKVFKSYNTANFYNYYIFMDKEFKLHYSEKLKKFLEDRC